MSDAPTLTQQELDGLKAWRRRFEMRRVAVVVAAAFFSGFIGWAYGAVFYGEYLSAEDAADPYRGFRTGAMIGFIAAAIELYYIRSVRRSWIGGWHFYQVSWSASSSSRSSSVQCCC